MPQTLGAFLAIMAVMTFTLNYNRSTIHSQRNMINTEMEVMASAVATDVMNYVASKPFDARTADNTVNRYNKITALLTPASEFGSCGSFGTCNDIDDFHNLPEFVRTFEIEPGVAIKFNVGVAVHYVDDTGAASTSQTWAKEVTVTVSEAESTSGIPYLFSPIKLKRQFSPQW